MKNLSFLLLSCLASLFMGCSDNSDEVPDGGEEQKDITQTVIGKVEKGPFVRGSIVTLRTLTAELNPTGSSFSATITNHAGDFDFGTITSNSQFAKLTAEGYFFDEVEGELSPSTLTLDAIVDLSDSKTVNVNLFTHLKSQRIVSLVKGGKSYKEANATAQKELLAAFGLQQYAMKDASQFSIALGDDASGVLIAVSSLVLYEKSVAETVEFISQLTEEFAELGTFRPTTKEQLRKIRNGINDDFDDIASNVKRRYYDLGIEIEVKDLSRYFDWDDDGVAGNEFDDDFKLETSSIQVPAEGGKYSVNLNSSKPYYLEVPEAVEDDGIAPGWSENEESYMNSLYENGYSPKGIKYTATISNGVVNIDVSKAEFKTSSSVFVSIYNARGKNVGNIELVQEGNKSLKQDRPNLGNDGKAVVAGVLYSLRDAYSSMFNLERNYVKSLTRIDETNSDVYQAWSQFYATINRIIQIKEVDKSQYGVYQNYCDTYLAMCYASMLSYWDGVPYYTERQGIDAMSGLPRTSKSDMITKLLELTEEPLENLDETTIEFGNINSLFFLSKDVVRLIRAQLYMEKGDYGTALDLYNTVINSGRYSLVQEDKIQYGDNSESIFYPAYAETRASVTTLGQPVFDLKTVYANAAECATHISDNNGADKYLSVLRSKKNLFSSGYSGLKEVQMVMKETMMPYIIPCMRRSGQSNCILDISTDNWYQMLFPIPSQEINTNMHITQNPGY